MMCRVSEIREFLVNAVVMIIVLLLSHPTDSEARRRGFNFLYVPFLILICTMTHSYMCAMTHSYMCAMTHSYMCRGFNLLPGKAAACMRMDASCRVCCANESYRTCHVDLSCHTRVTWLVVHYIEFSNTLHVTTWDFLCVVWHIGCQKFYAVQPI